MAAAAAAGERVQEAGRARSARTAACGSGEKGRVREVRGCMASGDGNLAAGDPCAAACCVDVGEVFVSVEERRGRACYHPPVGSAYSPRFHHRRSPRLRALPPLSENDELCLNPYCR